MAERWSVRHGEGAMDVEKAKEGLEKEEEGDTTPRTCHLFLLFCAAWKTKNLERARNDPALHISNFDKVQGGKVIAAEPTVEAYRLPWLALAPSHKLAR